MSTRDEDASNLDRCYMESLEIIKQALLNGASPGIETDACNVIDALMDAGWRPVTLAGYFRFSNQSETPGVIGEVISTHCADLAAASDVPIYRVRGETKATKE